MSTKNLIIISLVAGLIITIIIHFAIFEIADSFREISPINNTSEGKETPFKIYLAIFSVASITPFYLGIQSRLKKQ